MKPYSKDLRLRVLSAVDAGTPREQVAKAFAVSVPTRKRWLKRDVGRPEMWSPSRSPAAPKEGHSAQRVAAPPPGGKRRPHPRRAQRGFRGRVRPEGLHLHRWEGHRWPAPRRLAAQKKSKIASERDEEVRGLWRWLASHFDAARRLVFVDESGFHTSM